MTEVLWIILIIIAVMVALIVVGLAMVVLYFIAYSLFCLVTGRPNKLNVSSQQYDIDPEDTK